MKKNTFLGKYWEYIAAFLIPIIIVLIHCIVRKVWLFGDGSMLCGDAGVQYIYVFEELWNKVHSGDFSFYSWNALGGFDFYLNALYYTISPATIIILLLPRVCMEDALQFFMILKWALMAVSAVYFFMHTKSNKLKENRRFVSLVLGLCYAMSSFFIQVMQWFNWTDTMILFPILLLFVEQLVDQGKWKIYYWILLSAILCNFYIAFPVCIFLLIWFIIQLQTIQKDKFRRCFSFFCSSLMAGISAMFIILPSVINVSNRYSAGKEEEVKTYIWSILLAPFDIIKKFFIFDTIENGNDWNTSFYLSMSAIVLAMLFCFIKINKKEKISKIISIIFVFFSVFVGVLNYIWHGFSIPHGVTNRYAFILIMLILLLALDVVSYIEQVKIWQCIITLFVNMGLMAYTFFNLTVFEEFYIYLATILIMVFDTILLVLYCRKSIKKNSLIMVMFALCFVELCVNAYYQLSNYDDYAPDEVEFIAEADKLIDDITIEAGERLALVDAGYNLGLKKNISTMSGFVSYTNGKMIDLCSALGMNIINDAGFLYAGQSPLVNLMFNIHYGIGSFQSEFSNCVKEKEGEDVSLYQMQNVIGIGYMTQADMKEWTISESSFETQNNFVQNATTLKEKNLFEKIISEKLECTSMLREILPSNQPEEDGMYEYYFTPLTDEDGLVMKYEAEKDMDLYISLKGNEGYTPSVYVDEELVFYDSLARNNFPVHVGKIKKGQQVNIYCIVNNKMGKEIKMTMQLASFNEDVFAKAYEELSESTYQIKEMKSDMIDGEIEAKEDGIMMTSVQAVDGFEVFVDGEKTEYETIGGALIGVPLEKGKHTVTFRYRTPYAVLGWIISGVSILGVALVCILQHKKKDTEACLS